MKTTYKILIVFLFTLCSMHTNAQWANMNLPTLAAGNTIYFTSADTGYVVTADFNNGGAVWRTTDGLTWTNSNSVNEYLFAVHFVTNEIGWAAGGLIGGGIIMKTMDGGTTWNVQTDSCEQVMSIYFVNDSMGWAAANDASQGTYFIYHTSDGGMHWTTQQAGSDYVRSVFFISSTTGWVAGDNGRIYGTTNGGLNWNLLTNGIACHFNDIQFINDTLGWSVGSYVDGKCFKSIDGGTSWVQQTIPTIEPISSVQFISINIGWICGNNGTVLITYDGGATWQSEMSNTINNLTSIHMLNANVGHATGVNGTVIKYSNPVEVKNNEKNSSLKIYPNPNNGIFQLAFSTELMDEKRIEIEVLDVTGKSLRKIIPNSNENVKTVDLSMCPNGLYMLKIKTAHGNAVERILINK